MADLTKAVTARSACVPVADPPLGMGAPSGAGPGGRAWLAATLGLTLGSAAVAIALAPRGTAPAPVALAFLLFVGSSVHVASTAWFYTVPEVRRHMRRHLGRYLGWPIALLTGASVIALLVPRTAIYWLLLPYFGWQFYHYQKQNLGIAALAAVSARLPTLSRAERGALIAAGLAGLAALVSRPGLLQLPVRPVLSAAFPLATLAFGASALVGSTCLARRGRAHRTPGFAAAYLTSLLFSLPVFLFGSPYAAVAGLTIAHGMQYLLLVGLVAAGGPRGARRVGELAALCNTALLGGAALSLASDQLASSGPGRAVYGLFLGAVMAHFVIDAGLWRMRAEFPAAFLGARLPYLIPARPARP